MGTIKSAVDAYEAHRGDPTTAADLYSAVEAAYHADACERAEAQRLADTEAAIRAYGVDAVRRAHGPQCGCAASSCTGRAVPA